jgi:predicted phage terminase large subunit-like protein
MNNLDRIWLWYSATFLSRVSAQYGEPIEIITMTRWSSEDICGRVLKRQEEDNRKDWYVIRMPAYNEETGEMLCPSLFSYNRYKELSRLMVDSIFSANYKQQTMEATGLLFYRKDLKTFKKAELKTKPESIAGYIDVADAGDDSLAFVVGRVYKNKVFITDVIFTRDMADITIPLCAGLINKEGIDYVRVESNNMGRVFAGTLREKVGIEKILTVNNSTNKHTRILMQYGFIKEYFYFLDKSEYEPGSDYDKFINELLNYMKDGNSKHDDAPDALSGLAMFVNSWLKHLF